MLEETSFDPVPVEHHDRRNLREVVSAWWLTGVGVFGAILTAVAIFTSLRWPNMNPVWSGIELQFGSAILIFALLFVVERRFIRRQVEESTQQLIENITDESFAKLAMDLPEETRRLAEPGGPVEAATRWRDHVLAGDYVDAWNLSEDNWKLCRIQAWIYNNRTDLGLATLADLRACLNVMVSMSDHILWPQFFATERNQFLKAWSIGQQEWGVSSRRRCMGPGYELIITTPLGGRTSGYVVHGPAALPHSMQLLMHQTDDGWLLAAYDAGAPPQPGWPPAWWMPNDPAAGNVPQRGRPRR